jgi:hypothetical protein
MIRVALLAFVALAPLASFADSHLWQESTSASVTLGVRDKFADQRDTSTVTFVVRSVDASRTYKLTRTTTGDDFLEVRFPEDFTQDGMQGRYTWQGIVDGKVVANGDFSAASR